jgi:hypothetical protein
LQVGPNRTGHWISLDDRQHNMEPMNLTMQDRDAIRQIVRDELSVALNEFIRASSELMSSLPLDERKRRLTEWGGCAGLRPTRLPSPAPFDGEVRT